MIKNVISLAVLSSFVFASASFAQVAQPKTPHEFEQAKQHCKEISELLTSTEGQKKELESCYIQYGIATKPI